jgi:uncharacterized protein (DUF1800 family)
MSLEAAIAVQRFGLGARPGEIERASRDPKAWLMAQIGAPADQPQPVDGEALKSGGELVADLIQYQRERQMEKRSGEGVTDPVKQFFKDRVGLYMKEMQARFAQGFTSERPFAERLVWFWSNHFVVSAQNPRATTLVGAYEREAIRPHINGTFEEMLLAVVAHPAMLLYLDNAQSVGPDSMGGNFTGKGLNENLGRELMELYTLGVDAGYTQTDVIAMAKLLTGWTIDRRGGGQNGFAYVPAIHEPGNIVLRGKTYPAGFDGSVAAIRDLAHDPATAKHIARKFATHFISDTPTPETCARLEATFNRTGGNLRALAQTAIEDPAAWTPVQTKVRSPVEYVTAAFRMVNWPQGGDEQKQIQGAMGAVKLMGEFPLAAPSPKGWSETSDAWSGPDALLNRIEWARAFGDRIPQGYDAAQVGEATLGPLLRPATKTAISRAATPGEAVALLISSPEFQRR